ncbi:MAG: histidinol-phosphate transaminase [Pseudomonadales bacterium]
MINALYHLIRPHYRDLKGYVSAGMESGKDSERIFMNANENPFELPGAEGFNRYPEPQPPALLEAYANAFGVSEDQIVMTRGADEAIVVLTRLFCAPGEAGAVICPPTFGMYGVNSQGMPSQPIEVPLLKQQSSFALDCAGIETAVKESGSKLVFLCSPNNPTANSFPQQDIIELCRTLDGHAAVVLDETYIDFSILDSMAVLLSDLPNLIILRTLSKSYSMAGMRMGCLLCGDPDFVELIRSKCLDAYPLPKASIDAAVSVLSDEVRELAQGNVRLLLSQRELLREAFENSSHVSCVFPSDANFLLIEMHNPQDFLSYCENNHIILRDFSNKQGTENCIRVSVGTAEQNQKLMALLKDFSSI